MSTSCSAFRCNETRSKRSAVIFFTFPKAPEEAAQCRVKCRGTDTANTNNARTCSKRFTLSQYKIKLSPDMSVPVYLWVLKLGAVPGLVLPSS